MAFGGVISGILFIVGLGAIAISGGSMMYMAGGDALIALAGLSLAFFSR